MSHYDVYDLYAERGKIGLASSTESLIRFFIQPHSFLVWPPDCYGREMAILQFNVGIETPQGTFECGDEVDLTQVFRFRDKINAFCNGSPDVVIFRGVRSELLICYHEGAIAISARAGLRYLDAVGIADEYGNCEFHQQCGVGYRLSLDSTQEFAIQLNLLCEIMLPLATSEFRNLRKRRVCTPRRPRVEPSKPQKHLIDPAQGFVITGCQQDFSEHSQIPTIGMLLLSADEMQIVVCERDKPGYQYRAHLLNFSSMLGRFVEDARDVVLAKRRSAQLRIASDVMLEVIRRFDARCTVRISLGATGSLTGLLPSVGPGREQSVGFEAALEVEPEEVENLIENLHNWAIKSFWPR